MNGRVVIIAALVFVACRGEGDRLGPLESYQLLVPSQQKGGDGESGAPLRVQALALGEEPALSLGRVLGDGFGGEVVRTVHLAKQLVRHLGAGGAAAYPAAVVAAAGEPLLLVVGAPAAAVAAPSVEGIAFERLLGGPTVRPRTRWLGVSGNVEGDKALVQSLAGRMGAHAADWIARGAQPGPTLPLGEAYRMAMEVIAREWRPPGGASGSLKSTAGTMEQRRLFASVRENQAVVREDGTLRPAAELLADPRVGATVLHRLAQTRLIAQRAGPDDLYRPFVPAGLPSGVSPAAVLGSVRNFQAKLLTAWSDGVVAGKAPADIVDLIELYGKRFSDERPEVLRIFLVTTFAGTVIPGGVSQKPAEATTTLARITSLIEDVLAGRRGLRDALAAPPGQGSQ
jgi:hypothetical protein